MNTPQQITSRPILPGTFQCVEKAAGYAHRSYLVTGPVEQFSDRDLLTYCQYTPEFGGRVERMPGVAYVTVGFNKHKSANLGEAYKHFTGLDLIDAHSALADVQACMQVYFAIKEIP